MDEFGGSFGMFDDILARYPALGEAYVWAIAAPVLIIGIFLARYLLRRAVDRKVRSIQTMGADFGGLELMRRRGLISEEEYRAARKKTAERQLREMQARESGADPRRELQAFELDPELLRAQAQESQDPRVRASLAGLGRKHDDAELEAWRKARPTAYDYGRGDGANPGTDSEERKRPSDRESAVMAPAPLEPLPADGAWVEEILVPGDPLSDERLRRRGAPEAPPAKDAARPAPAPPRAGDGRSGDLERMLERGLVTREEYDRLRALLERT